MPDSLPSRTAAGVAWLRAAHQLLDAPPLILDDPAILAILGPASVERLREKRARLADAGLAVPINVAFAEVDFENVSLAEGLHRHGVRLDEPTFFSWLGVTMYLTEPAIDAVFGMVAGSAPGSEMVFTFAPPPSLDDIRRAAPAGPTLAERAAAVGEPWRTYFELATLERKLRGFGFGTVDFLTPADAAERYFEDRADALPAPRRATIVRVELDAAGARTRCE